MDPNTLSTDQGKELLKRCGIPQRDVDMLVEKWMVVASVEAMLRFPLLPGEDPAARCISKGRAELPADKPPAVSASAGQETRKANTRLENKSEQKAKALKQTARPCAAQPPPRRPAQPRASPAEGENFKVKCKDCGAFGHTARSSRCAMKLWGGAVPLLPVGSRQQKENRKPQNLQQPWSQAHREEEGRERQGEPPKQALPWALPGSCQNRARGGHAEPEEACPFVRHPTKPLPVHSSRRKSPAGSAPRCPPAAETATRSFCPALCPSQRPALSSAGFSSSNSHRPASNTFNPGSSAGAQPAPPRPATFTNDVPPRTLKTLPAGHVLLPQEQVTQPGVVSKWQPQPLRQKCGQNGPLDTQMSGKRPVRDALQTSQKPPKKARHSTSQPLPGTRGLAPMPATSIGGFAPHRAAQGSTETASVPTPKVGCRPPPTSHCPNPGPGSAGLQPRPSSYVPGKTPQVGFQKWEQGLKSSSSRTAALSNPCGQLRPAPQSSQVPTEPETQAAPGTASVLYEDLLLSPSSGDSD